MATGEDGGGEYNASRDLVRTAAKWFVAGLGGIGVVLVAGSQLSSIGGLPPDSSRLYLAIGGVVVGLLAILWAMWRVVDVLAGRPWAFEDLVTEWQATAPTSSKKWRKRLKHWRATRQHPVGKYMHDHPSSFGNFGSPVRIKEIYDESEPDRPGLDDLVELMDELLEKTATISLQSRFRDLRRQIAGGVILGAAGIILFAWAANPAKSDQPPASFRNADLHSADLRGVSMRNADLSGADFTGADLYGADLSGAKTDGTIWSNTICPDGTNSDTRARPDSTGKLTGGTCEGHFVPLP